MLSLFPSLLTYILFAPLFLRLILGVTLIYFSRQQLSIKAGTTYHKLAGLIEGLCGALLIIGLFTQGAALVVAIILGARLVQKIRAKAFLTDGINYYLVLFIIALSLLVTGAGAIAFDLPF